MKNTLSRLTATEATLVSVIKTLKEVIMADGETLDTASFNALMDVWEEIYNIQALLTRWDTDGERLQRELINETMMDDTYEDENDE